MRRKHKLPLLILILLSSFGMPGFAVAQPVPQASSSHYSVNEVFFGSGGALQDCSTNYCAKESVGETAAGNTSSPNYQAHAGFNTDRTPYLEFTVSNTNVNLGTLSSSTTKTTTATFSVKSYLSSGYTVKQVSAPPTNGSYTMQALTTPTASSTGTEQFGINLVANTSPTAFGANPAQNPGSTFSFGQVASGYDTPNHYKYISGDTIAYSNKSSGETDYTISYIFNVSNITPGGQYTMHHDLVATATF